MRSWWQKKRWWSVGLLFMWVISYFIPYSINGPAMSCWTMVNESENDIAMYEYARKTGYDVGKTVQYMSNSGMRLRNITTQAEGQVVSFVFITDYNSKRCLLFKMLSIDGSTTVLDISIYGERKGKVIEQ